MAGQLPAHCMSEADYSALFNLLPLPNPHTSTSPIPFVAVPDIRISLWHYRLQRSLQTNWSGGRLLHQPYYRPFSALDDGYTHPPFLIGADHVFEWRSGLHGYPVCIVLFSINPSFHFTSPQVVITNHLTYQCPYIHILYWDCPLDLPLEVCEFIQHYEQIIEHGLTEFLTALEQFALAFYTPTSPYDHSIHSPLRPPAPPHVPHIPTNPNTIPLTEQQ